MTTKFTKKHYQAIAKVIAETKGTKGDLIANLMTMFEADNPKFNEATFMAAIRTEVYLAAQLPPLDHTQEIGADVATIPGK